MSKASKTIKIKIRPTKEQEQMIRGWFGELNWAWDLALKALLKHHCLAWYRWASGRGGAAFLGSDRPPDFEGCVLTPLQFSSRTSYSYAACQIAIGGDYWQVDEDAAPIPYRRNGKTEYKPAMRLVKGDRSWERITPEPYEPMLIALAKKMVEFTGDSITKEVVDHVRAEAGLAPLSMHSDYIKGLSRSLQAAWTAYLDPKLAQRHKPKFKRDSTDGSLISDYPIASIDLDNGLIWLKSKELGAIKIGDRSYRQRLNLQSMIIRSHTITHRPSGWYINLVVDHPNQAALAQIKPAINKAKREHGAESEQYAGLIAQRSRLIGEVEESLHDPGKGLVCGIDPGINAVVATEHGALFQPNVTRERITVHIEQLQSKLDRIIEVNNKKLGKKRSPTKNEQKLREKIARLHERGANSANAFNHKLSTRLSRTYSDIRWEDTDLLKMFEQVDPKMDAKGTYLRNGKTVKRDLNWKLRQRSLGDLKAKTKTKMERQGRTFRDVPAPGTTANCHCCGEPGKLQDFTWFICLNPDCAMHETMQHNDYNAALNMRRAIITEGCADGKALGAIAPKYEPKPLKRRHFKTRRKISDSRNNTV